MWDDKTVNVGDMKFTFGLKQHISNQVSVHAAKFLQLTGAPVPNHIAFCMDGNRRYAKKESMTAGTGHIAGFESMLRILLGCNRVGVKTATVYAFSIENFNRSPEESETLFGLVRAKLWTMVQDKDSALRKLGWRIRFPGHRDMLQEDLIERMNEIEKVTETCNGMLVNICAPYTTRDDLASAILKCTSKSTPIDYDVFHSSRQMAPCEPLDIFIRTSGETRLSDFMAWEIEPGSMVEFIPELWPEFSVWQLYRIIAKWQVRTLMLHYRMKSLSSIGPAPPKVSVSKTKKAQ